jgi:chromosomal replication initiator protein
MMMSDGVKLDGPRPPKDLARLWDSVIARSVHALGRDAAEQWIRPVRLKAIENDLATLTAPTNFLADWVERNYGLHLLRCLQGVMPEVRRIVIAVA